MKYCIKTIQIFILLLSFTYLISGAFATSIRMVELTCPVCEAPCKGRMILSTNSFGGQDRDFLRRAVGSQPILLTPITCSKCLYSGYVKNFKEVVSQEIKMKILNEKVIKIPNYKKLYSERVKNDPERIPAWVRHDLIAQIMILNNKDYEELAWQHMITSWAVRLEENPFEFFLHNFTEDENNWINNIIKSLMEKENQNKNRALVEIQISKILLENLLSYPQINRQAVAVYAGYLLRNHGENEFLLLSKQFFRPYFSKKDWNTLTNELTLSVNLERKYQIYAIELYKRILNMTEESEKRAVFTYLVGELFRRLGDYKNAIAYFGNIKRIEGAPDWIVRYADEQKSISVKK